MAHRIADRCESRPFAPNNRCENCTIDNEDIKRPVVITNSLQRTLATPTKTHHGIKTEINTTIGISAEISDTDPTNIRPGNSCH